MADFKMIEANTDTPFINELTKAPRYHQVYALLKGWIYDGTFPPGSKLPAESELCETFGVSKITTRKAIDMLASEKLLVRVQGKGTYVTEDLADAPNLGDMEQLIRKTRKLAQKSSVENVEIKEIIADEEVVADLALEAGEHVQKISFVRYMDGRPIGYRIAFVPSRSGLNFTVDEIKKNQMLTLLEKKGVRISGADQLIGACLADTTKASLLKTTVGAPLVRIRLVVFNDQGKPIEASTGFYLADRYQHHIYLTRSPDRRDDVVGAM